MNANSKICSICEHHSKEDTRELCSDCADFDSFSLDPHNINLQDVVVAVNTACSVAEMLSSALRGWGGK